MSHRVGWTTAKCAAGHTHRSSAKRHAVEVVHACNARAVRLLVERGLSFESTCESCVRRLLAGKPVRGPRTCPECGDAVCLDFFPTTAKVCGACQEA